MDHPLHDDSHIPAAIESTSERIEELVLVLTDTIDQGELVDIAIQHLTNEYEANEDKFQEDWQTYMETK